MFLSPNCVNAVASQGMVVMPLISFLQLTAMDLKGRGFKKGIKALKKVTPPAILFWEFNHFLVFEGFIGDKIALNDPVTWPSNSHPQRI